MFQDKLGNNGLFELGNTFVTTPISVQEVPEPVVARAFQDTFPPSHQHIVRARCDYTVRNGRGRLFCQSGSQPSVNMLGRVCWIPFFVKWEDFLRNPKRHQVVQAFHVGAKVKSKSAQLVPLQHKRSRG